MYYFICIFFIMKFLIPVILLVIPVLWYLINAWSWLWVGLIIDIVLIVMSLRIVKPNTVRSVEFLWKFNRILRQWFHLIIPFFEVTRIQYLYKRNFSVKVEWVTSDNVTCYIGLNVISYVDDDDYDTYEWNIYKSIYSIDDPITMIKATIDEQLRAMIVQFSHKAIFWKREEIWLEIESQLREKLKTFGYTLDSIQVRDVNLDDTVMTAMNKVVESEKVKESAYNEAEADKIKQVRAAEADKEAKKLLGEGMAEQREAIAKWFTESIAKIKWSDKSLEWREVLQFLLDSSRIETLENVGRDNAKIVYVNENLEAKRSSMIQWQNT